MNLFKRLFYAGVRAQAWEHRAKRKLIHKLFHPLTKSVKKLAGHRQPKGIEHKLEISIWYRPLDQSLLSRIFTRSISHWCIQVGNHYYELRLNKEHQPISPEPLFENPFEIAKRKKIPRTTYTNLAAEEVDEQAQALFDTEFQRYSPGMEDCQQFCLRLLELICPNDRAFKDIKTYLYINSFAYQEAIALDAPPPR